MWSSNRRAKVAFSVLIVMAVPVFVVVPALQSALGGDQLLWATVTLLVAIFAWVLYRRIIAPPRVWREGGEDGSGRKTLVLLRESATVDSGVGALRVLPEGIEIDFPDRERLVFEWAAIAGVALAQEAIGRKWKVVFDRGEGLDPVVIYPLADDGVSMAAGKQAAQKLFAGIESARPPQDT